MVGRRYANGMEMKDRQPSMSSIVGYLPQFDLYIGTLTVREHLEFLVCDNDNMRNTEGVKRDKVTFKLPKDASTSSTRR